METFSEEISAEACSGKEIAGLLRKMMMKGDVGMSLHEKQRNKKMPTLRHKVTHNPIPTSLCLPRPQRNIFRRQLDVKMFCCLLCLMLS